MRGGESPRPPWSRLEAARGVKPPKLIQHRRHRLKRHHVRPVRRRVVRVLMAFHEKPADPDRDGGTRSQMTFPASSHAWNSGAWRFLPVRDLCGESESCPYEGTDAC